MYVNSCAFWLSLTILQVSADNADTLSRLLDRIGSLCNVLLTAFEKLKESNRHGIPLADLKGNIQTLIGSVDYSFLCFGLLTQMQRAWEAWDVVGGPL